MTRSWSLHKGAKRRNGSWGKPLWLSSSVATAGSMGSQPAAETAVRLKHPFVCAHVCMGRVRIQVQLLDGSGWSGCLSPVTGGMHQKVSRCQQMGTPGFHILGKMGVWCWRHPHCIYLYLFPTYVFSSDQPVGRTGTQNREHNGAISVYVRTQLLCLCWYAWPVTWIWIQPACVCVCVSGSPGELHAWPFCRMDLRTWSCSSLTSVELEGLAPLRSLHAALGSTSSVILFSHVSGFFFSIEK